MTDCNAIFYLLQSPKLWQARYAPVPANHLLLNSQKENAFPPEVDFDVILAQSTAHMAQGLALSRQLHLPLVRMEHTLPYPEWPKHQVERLRELRGHVNVTVSDYNRQSWGFGDDWRVIHHGLDTDFFSPGEEERQPQLLSVVNDWINRDWACGFRFWQEATRELPTKVVGDTPGLSRPARDVSELVSLYRQSRIFVNTTLVSSAPVSPLEAMSCGCAVVSTDTTTMPNVIEHGVNGLLATTPQEMHEHCRTLLADAELCRRLGEAARRTIIERFSVKDFVKNWNNLLREAANVIYRGAI
jgi:hypothetical protein